MTTTRPLAAALALATTVALAGCSSQAGPIGSSGAASCVALIDYDGVRYVGQGNLDRDPPTTGRKVDVVVPACDDTGGLDREPAEHVRAAVLADVPPDTALLYDGAVYVREGSELPPAAGDWFTAPRG